jgi:hypothetical protein
MFGSSVALMSGRDSSSLRSGESHLLLMEGFNLVMSLKSHGIGEGPTGLHDLSLSAPP